MWDTCLSWNAVIDSTISIRGTLRLRRIHFQFSTALRSYSVFNTWIMIRSSRQVLHLNSIVYRLHRRLFRYSAIPNKLQRNSLDGEVHRKTSDSCRSHRNLTEGSRRHWSRRYRSQAYWWSCQCSHHSRLRRRDRASCCSDSIGETVSIGWSRSAASHSSYHPPLTYLIS